MIPSPLQPLANHLWQSTLFAAVTGLLTLALRNNRAQTRYSLWLAASMKFLIPFSLLVDMGSHWRPHATPAITTPLLSYVIEQASQPFSLPTPPPTTTGVPTSSLVNWVPAILATVWAIGFATLIWSWWRRWRGLRATLRTASPLDLQIGMEAMISPAFAEPGVFGVSRPVLLMPAGITDRLTPPQLKTIVAHELCHIRRRDNLTAAIHMGVEALYWFHPLVWWLGARLMEERERACDEEVLLMGSDPGAYAEGILKICELYLESPLRCVSGVAGANLRKRIEEIMSKRIGIRLSSSRKIGLAAAGVAVLLAPVVIGALYAPVVQAQSSPSASGAAVEAAEKFEVVSVKTCSESMGPVRKGERKSGSGQGASSPGRLRLNCQTVLSLIQWAYVNYSHDRFNPLAATPISGGPSWINSDLYEINAKTARPRSPGVENGSMLRALLEDRLKLKIHRETTKAAVYALTVAKGGPKLQRAKEGNCTPLDPDHPPAIVPGKPFPRLCGMASLTSAGYNAYGVTMGDFSRLLSDYLDRTAIDNTGVTGRFDIHLELSAAELGHPAHGLPNDSEVPAARADADDTSYAVRAAVEKLGLKLKPATGPGERLVIDHVEKPSAN